MGLWELLRTYPRISRLDRSQVLQRLLISIRKSCSGVSVDPRRC